MRGIAWMLTLAAGLAIAPPLRAQADECDYDRCALRLQHRFFGTHVARGIDSERIARIGFFAPTIEPLARAGDSARIHYEAFRALHSSGSALQLVGGVMAVVAALIIYDEGAYTGDPLPVGVGITGLGLAIWGSERTRVGSERLSRSIWWYNRSLPK